MRAPRWNPATISAMGVALAQQRLLEAGFGVAVPVVREPWDLLVYRKRRVWRVEVKATATDMRVDCRRGHDKRLHYCPQRVDAVCGVHVVKGMVVFVPTRWLNGRRSLYFSLFKDFSHSDMLLRCKPPKRVAD